MLIKLLTDPKNFKFYNGGQGYTGNGNQPGLTNIPYGKDQIGGGSSGQPYIQIPIPDNISSLGLPNNDFLLRGGTLSVENAATDTLRLTKMFGDLKSPNGLLFIAKQQLLSRTAVRTQTSGFLNAGVYNPLGTLAQAGIVNIGGHLNKQGNILDETGAYSTNDALYGVKVKPSQATANNRLVRIYSSIINNTSAKVSGSIYNQDDAGVNIITYPGGPGSYLGALKTNIRFADQRTGKENIIAKNYPAYFTGNNPPPPIPNLNYTPVFLHDRKDIEEKKYFSTVDKFKSKKGVSQTYFTLVPLTSGSIYPDNLINNEKSVYTQGNTFLKNSSLINDNGTYVYNQADIIAETPIRGTYNTTQDFRATLRNNTSNPQSIATSVATNTGQLAYSLDYNIGAGKTIEKRVNLGDPGNRAANKDYAYYDKGVLDKSKSSKSFYSSIGENSLGPVTENGRFGSNVEQQLGLDGINSLPVYGAKNVDTSGYTNDLVKFRIAIIKNDDPSFKTFIHFRALLDSISDSYNATWNPVQYLGRGESFYNYNGFTRQLSLSWTVAAQSKEELIPMYKKLNFLASSLAPDYSPSGYMRGNMVQLTIGGYVYEQPGIITGLTYTMEETSPWEIGIKTDYDIGRGTVQGDDSVKELTHIIKVSGFNFIPIHRFRPGVQNYADQNDEKHFIALANGANNNYSSKLIKNINE